MALIPLTYFNKYKSTTQFTTRLKEGP